MDILLLLLAITITFSAQIYVSSTYNKNNNIKSEKNITGFEVARQILDSHGLNNVYITETNGFLSDHYDSTRKVIRLSKEVFHGKSIASVSVAAHEVGHAIQDKNGYQFMRFRSLIFPLVNFASYTGYFAILIGVLLNSIQFIWLGIALEIIILLFQLITLPVEFDASNRALSELKKHKILTKKELNKSKIMLNAAALTYVASVLNTVLQILRLIIIYGNSNNKE